MVYLIKTDKIRLVLTKSVELCLCCPIGATLTDENMMICKCVCVCVCVYAYSGENEKSVGISIFEGVTF